MSTEAENWLQIKYPELVELWQSSYLSNIDKTKRYGEECVICRLRSNTGSHYGVYTCEADKQFLKRTFHDKQVYPVCNLQCPPRFRGWCQYCRLKSSLSSGINLKMIRTAYNLKRVRSKPSCNSSLDTTSSIKRVKVEPDEDEVKSTSLLKIKTEPFENSPGETTKSLPHNYAGYEPLQMEHERKPSLEFINGRIQDYNYQPDSRRDSIPPGPGQQIKREYSHNEPLNRLNKFEPGYRVMTGQDPRSMTSDMFPPGWPHSRESALELYYSNLNYLKYHHYNNPQYAAQYRDQHTTQDYSRIQHPPQHSPQLPYQPQPMYHNFWSNTHPDHSLPPRNRSQEQSIPEQPQDSWYRPREYSNMSPPNSSNSSPPRHEPPQAPSAPAAPPVPATHIRSYEKKGFKLTRPTAVYGMRPTDLSSATVQRQQHAPFAHTPSIEHHDSLGNPITNPSTDMHQPPVAHLLDASHEVLHPRGVNTPDSNVNALHPSHFMYMPSPPYTNSSRCSLSPMQTEPMDLSSSSGSASHTSSRPSSRCSSVPSAPSRPPSAGSFPSPRSAGTSLNKWSVNSAVLQEALSIIQPGLSPHSSFRNISHVSDILSESSCV